MCFKNTVFNWSPVHLDLENLVVVIFFKNAKKITRVGWSSRCKFFWNVLDQTTTTGSSHFLSPNGQGLSRNIRLQLLFLWWYFEILFFRLQSSAGSIYKNLFIQSSFEAIISAKNHDHLVIPILRTLSVSSQAYDRQLSGSSQAALRQFSGSSQAVLRQFSGSSQHLPKWCSLWNWQIL